MTNDQSPNQASEASPGDPEKQGTWKEWEYRALVTFLGLAIGALCLGGVLALTLIGHILFALWSEYAAIVGLSKARFDGAVALVILCAPVPILFFLTRMKTPRSTTTSDSTRSLVEIKEQTEDDSTLSD